MEWRNRILLLLIMIIKLMQGGKQWNLVEPKQAQELSLQELSSYKMKRDH